MTTPIPKVIIEMAAKALYEADDVWHIAFPWPECNTDQLGAADTYRRLAQAVLEGAGYQALVEQNALLEKNALIANARAMQQGQEITSIKHRAFGHIDCLLLYATCYPNDSNVKEAVEFCRALDPKRRLRMEGQLS